jgi:hypothetical protein
VRLWRVRPRGGSRVLAAEQWWCNRCWNDWGVSNVYIWVTAVELIMAIGNK